jgi:peroxisomal membrane protein 2
MKMALYGALVSAPMGHLLVGLLQRAFAGKTSNLARFGQVLASNVFVAPVQAFGDSIFGAQGKRI